MWRDGRVVDRESVWLTEAKKGQGWAILLDPAGEGRLNLSVDESKREFGVVMPCGCVFDHERQAVVQVWRGGCPAVVDVNGRGYFADRGEEVQRLACVQRSELKDCGCWVEWGKAGKCQSREAGGCGESGGRLARRRRRRAFVRARAKRERREEREAESDVSFARESVARRARQQARGRAGVGAGREAKKRGGREAVSAARRGDLARG